MFGITLVSEVVDDRSFISMAEDLWTLPFLIAIYTLPAKPNQWLFFVCPSFGIITCLTMLQGLISGLLSYPYVHDLLIRHPYSR